MKHCKTCTKEKEETDFYETGYIRKDGTRARYRQCKSCHIKQSAKQREGTKRKNYLKYQRTYAKTHKKETRLERLAQLDKIKETKGLCLDCARAFPPECMDFDHINPATKLFSISNAVMGGTPWPRILEEIEKCRLICSNCHRIRTARQQRRGLRV